jgi:hypothetical protein
LRGQGQILIQYANENPNINDLVQKISLFEKPTDSSMTKSIWKVLNLQKLRGNLSFFHRISEFVIDHRNDWTVDWLRVAIATRLSCFTQSIDKFSRNDLQFDVIDIDFTNVKVFKSFMMASNERVDSKLWSRQSRANVLVVCPWRDQHVTTEIHQRHGVLSQNKKSDRDSSFPKEGLGGPAGFLHPALVHCFLEVSYNVASKQYSLDHPANSSKGSRAGLWANAEESQIQTLTAVFALCDFYKSNIHRKSHEYGGLAELWTTGFYNLPFQIEPRSIEQLDHVSKLQLASHLVPINRLAGKFLPGLPPQTAEEQRDKVAQNMLVLRVPIRL